MGECHVAAAIDVDSEANLNDLLRARVEATGDETLIERKTAAGAWLPVTAREFDAEVVAVAKGLIARGLPPGGRVGLLSRTRYEWTVIDWAVWAAGGILVPLYETSSAEQIEWILGDAEVELLVVEDLARADVVETVRDQTPGLREVLVIEAGAIAALTAAGAEVPDEEIARRRSLSTLADDATIIYTSGTTGRPKGAVLTHGNLYRMTVNAVEDLHEVVREPGSRTLLFMPLAHVFARFIEVLVVPAGSVLGHTPDTRTLLEDLASFRPTYVLAVPRVFEKVYNSAEQKAALGGRLKVFRWAAKVSVTYSRALDDGGPSVGLRLQHRLADALVYRRLRAALGGQARWAISGGAALGERLGHFYRGLGLHVLEGYGLTETTAPATVNRPHRARIGTVGPPMPGTSVRVEEDGEILLRGPHVFARYHRDERATAEVLQDGWFRTGDLGSLDAEGNLSITGRKKEIIVTAGGKNVAPAVLEDRLRSHPLVSQVVVVGDGRPFVAALITLDPEGLPVWLRTHGKPVLTVHEARTDPDVLASLEAAVERTNRAVSRAESIRKFTVLGSDLTVDNGYLTPSLKVRRALVLKDFAAEIEDLYGETTPR